MYNLSYFKENDPAKVLQFMKDHPFAMLIGCAADKPTATQLPFLIEEREGKIFLIAHMMRKQDHHLAFEKNPEALVVFTGPHTYVSATWYTNPHQGSTWNYMSVHVRGKLSFKSEKELVDTLRKLSLHFENNNPHAETVFDNLSEEYVSKLLPAIIGLEIEVSSIENVFKLSQNRDKESYENIKLQLSQQHPDAKEIAQQMDDRTSQLFNGHV